MRRIQVPLLLAAAFITPDPSAQSQSGTTSALALAFSLDTPEPSSGRDEVYLKAPTSTGAVYVPGRAQQVGERTYALSDLFGAYAPFVQLSAWSTGCSEIPGLAAEGNWPNLAQSGNWMLAVVSVSDETEGLPGSPIAVRQARPTGRDTPGADLYGYYMSHSVGLSPYLAGTARLERRCEELGPAATADIDALDYGMGVITHAQNEPHFVFFYNQDELFFALDSSCLPIVNAIAGANGFASGQPAAASTIYRLPWDYQNNRWDAPEVHMDALELGIPAEAEVDALAVDTIRGNLVFSTKRTSGLPQLLFHEGWNYGVSVEFLDGDGQPVTKKVGVKSNDVTDEVDGVDILDPHEGIFGFTAGTGLGSLGAAGDEIKDVVGVSMTRSTQWDDAGRPSGWLHLQCTGWGTTPPAQGFVLFLVADNYVYGADYALGLVPWKGLALLARSPADYAVDLTVPVPTTALALPLAVRALALDGSGRQIGESWAVAFDV